MSDGWREHESGKFEYTQRNEPFDAGEALEGKHLFFTAPERIEVAAWSSQPPEQHKSEQVHLLITLPEDVGIICVRFKGPDTLRFIAGEMLKLCDEVWPSPPKCTHCDRPAHDPHIKPLLCQAHAEVKLLLDRAYQRGMAQTAAAVMELARQSRRKWSFTDTEAPGLVKDLTRGGR